MLGRTSRDSAALATLAAHAAGWAQDGAEILDLGTDSSMLMTLAAIDDLAGVLHIGHPAQPLAVVARELLEAPAGVVVTGAVAVPMPWVWVGARPGASGDVVVDEAGMRDCGRALRSLGLNPRLVATSVPVAERVALAGVDGTLVVEHSEVPVGWTELAGSDRLAGEPIWYGLVQARRGAVLTEPSQVWLALGPSDDHRGSLGQVLAVIADHGIDLKHLRSQRTSAGPHAFYASFACQGEDQLSGLLRVLSGRGVRHRLLATIPGTSFVPGPQVVTPQWDAPVPDPGPAL